jgi:hypothetical protein
MISIQLEEMLAENGVNSVNVVQFTYDEAYDDNWIKYTDTSCETGVIAVSSVVAIMPFAPFFIIIYRESRI